MSQQIAIDALKAIYASGIAVRLKSFESVLSVPAHQPFLVRIDGCSFHTFLKVLRVDGRVSRSLLIAEYLKL